MYHPSYFKTNVCGGCPGYYCHFYHDIQEKQLWDNILKRSFSALRSTNSPPKEAFLSTIIANDTAYQSEELSHIDQRREYKRQADGYEDETFDDLFSIVRAKPEINNNQKKEERII